MRHVPELIFDPSPTALAKLRQTNTTITAEVDELLKNYGITLLANELRWCCFQSLLERFSSLDASYRVSFGVQDPILGDYGSVTGADYFEKSLRIRWDGFEDTEGRPAKQYSGRTFERLDWIVPMQRIYRMARRDADYQETPLETLDEYQRTEFFTDILLEEGLNCSNIYAMLKSGFVSVVGLVFFDSSPEQWAMLDGSIAGWRTIPLCDKAAEFEPEEGHVCDCVTRRLSVVPRTGNTNTYGVTFVLNKEFDETEHDESGDDDDDHDDDEEDEDENEGAGEDGNDSNESEINGE